jgi:diacylglycerol kinase family enzyme
MRWRGIPIDLEAALDLALGEHSVRAIDVLETDGKYFLMNVSAGTGAIILRTIQREEIRKLGRFSYLWKGFLQVMGYPPHRFDLFYDGKAVSFRASEVIIANSGVIGINNMRLDEDIHLDDGKFSICRINATSLLDYVVIGFNMLAGKQNKDPRLVCWEAGQSVRIASRKRLPVQADGELIGYLPVEVKLVPTALKVIIPPKQAE